MAAIDKSARLEAGRQQAEGQTALKVQQLDPPFPFRLMPFDEKLLIQWYEGPL